LFLNSRNRSVSVPPDLFYVAIFQYPERQIFDTVAASCPGLVLHTFFTPFWCLQIGPKWGGPFYLATPMGLLRLVDGCLLSQSHPFSCDGTDHGPDIAQRGVTTFNIRDIQYSPLQVPVAGPLIDSFLQISNQISSRFVPATFWHPSPRPIVDDTAFGFFLMPRELRGEPLALFLMSEFIGQMEQAPPAIRGVPPPFLDPASLSFRPLGNIPHIRSSRRRLLSFSRLRFFL